MRLRRSHLWHQVFAALIAFSGLFIIWVGSSYRLGQLSNIGPGFFPIVIGVGVFVVAIAIFVFNIRAEVDRIKLPIRSITLVTLSVLIFALTIERLGIVPATVLLTVIAAYADRQMTAISCILIVLFVLSVAVGLFHFGFSIPAPLFRGL